MPQISSLSSLVDEFGELERQLAPMRPIARRRDTVAKQIQAQIEGPDDETVTVPGEIYQVIAGPREIRRVITDMKALFKRVGEKLFLRDCTFPFKALDRLNVDTADIVSEDRSGSRTLSVVLRESASARTIAAPARKSRAKAVA